MSDNFWKRFDVQDKSKKKQVGLYEIENIDNFNYCNKSKRIL